MPHLITTLGPKSEDEVGMILPHEHVFANFIDGRDFDTAPGQVVERLKPAIADAQGKGISAFVDATAVGGARRIDIMRAISQATDMPLVVATGIFKEPFKADWVREKGETGLAQWMIRELIGGIEDSGICAGWIKLSVADEGLREHEITLLRAAARAGIETGAAIGVHTVSGSVALDQLDIIEEAGYRPDRFIWVHTQVEPDFDLHLQVAQRGAWIEYDAVGVDRSDAAYVELIWRLVDAGYAHQLLLSHDRNGYNPQEPNGGDIQPYTHIVDSLLPEMRKANIDSNTVQQITQFNPFNAYAR